MFKLVKVFTERGEEVADVRILNFNPQPDVLFWGQRIFTLRGDGRYLEASSAVVFTDEELKVMGIPPENLAQAVEP